VVLLLLYSQLNLIIMGDLRNGVLPWIGVIMPISRESLEKRLTQAKEQFEQLKQNLSATQGVIADLEYWLGEESKPEPEVIEDKVVSISKGKKDK
jgi:hypothetical protein